MIHTSIRGIMIGCGGGNFWDDHPGGASYPVLTAHRNIWRWFLPYPIPGGGGNEDIYPLVDPSECAPGPNVFNQPSPQSVQQSAQLSNNPSSQQNHKQPSFLILRYILGLL